jgi:hypothetical protein
VANEKQPDTGATVFAPRAINAACAFVRRCS